MSVAYDYSVEEFALAEGAVPAELFVPAPPPRRDGRALASVSVLHAPADHARPPLRITRRGQVVLALLVALLGAGLLWAAVASAPSQAAPAHGPAVVTVRAGDTLWSIASRVAPNTDPGAEVAVLRTRNHLTGVDLVPGQTLRVR